MSTFGAFGLYLFIGIIWRHLSIYFCRHADVFFTPLMPWNEHDERRADWIDKILLTLVWPLVMLVACAMWIYIGIRKLHHGLVILIDWLMIQLRHSQS